MSNLSVSKVPRKTKYVPWPTLGEGFNSHSLLNEDKIINLNNSIKHAL
jgi:hypothetical protein